MSQEQLECEEQIEKTIPNNQLVQNKVREYYRYNFRLLIKSRLKALHLSLKDHFQPQWTQEFGHSLIKSIEFTIGNQVMESREVNPRTKRLEWVPHLGWFESALGDDISEE